MKKIISVLLALLMLFSASSILFSCSKDEEADNEDKIEASSENAPSSEPEAPAEDIPVVEPDEPVEDAPVVEPDEPVEDAPVIEPEAPVEDAPVIEPEAPVKDAPVIQPEAPVEDIPAVEPEAPVEEVNPIFYKRSLISDDLKEVDYGGRSFRIATSMPEEFYFDDSERNTGDLIINAKLARNEAVEKRFNVKLELAYATDSPYDVANYVSKSILSGNDEFDLVMEQFLYMGAHLTRVLFLDWYDIENINFYKPWWDKANVKDLTYEGITPFAISDFNFSSITSINCIAFNKSIVNSYELGDLYKIVRDGEWTIDKLHEMVKDIYIDNGNDKRDTGDFYGLCQTPGIGTNTYLWAFDNPICTRDKYDIPQITIKTDKIDDITKKICETFNKTDGVYYFTNSEKPDAAIDMFLNTKAVFTPVTLGHCIETDFANFSDGYGILPYPKWDQNQKSYFTASSPQHTILTIPRTCADTAFVGTIVEALSAETWKTVTPTFYEVALKENSLTDDGSRQMLDIIVNGCTREFGYIYGANNTFIKTIEEAAYYLEYEPFDWFYDRHYSQVNKWHKDLLKAIYKIP